MLLRIVNHNSKYLPNPNRVRPEDLSSGLHAISSIPNHFDCWVFDRALLVKQKWYCLSSCAKGIIVKVADIVLHPLLVLLCDVVHHLVSYYVELANQALRNRMTLA